MSNVVHRLNGSVQTSVNTPDYPSEVWAINPTWTIDPDEVPDRYRKVVVDTDEAGKVILERVVEMSDPEKVAVDAKWVELIGLEAAKAEAVEQVKEAAIAAIDASVFEKIEAAEAVAEVVSLKEEFSAKAEAVKESGKAVDGEAKAVDGEAKVVG